MDVLAVVILLVAWLQVLPLQVVLLGVVWWGRFRVGGGVPLPLKGKWMRWFLTGMILALPAVVGYLSRAEILAGMER